MAKKCAEQDCNFESSNRFIDLHIHLDGTVTAPIAKKLAALQGITLPAEDEQTLESLLRVPEDCSSLDEFLKYFDLPLSLMQSYEGLSEAAFLMVEELGAHNVIYGEVRYAPQLHTQRGLTQEQTLLAVLDGLNRSRTKVNVILIMMRGSGNEAENYETLRLAEKYLTEDGGVVAVDLAGAEAQYPTENYRELFAAAREKGIPFTIHSGEADGPESVRIAVEFGARRVGHGVRSRESEAVLRLLAERGTFLEMCPTSNIKTFAIDDINDYPIMDFLGRGIRVTLNSDDPALVGSDISAEYRFMEDVFDITDEQRKTILSNSVDAAFTTEAVKAELRKELGI